MALHKTGVKMVNMQVVRLTYHVAPHLIFSVTTGKKSEYTQFECENLL